MVRLLAMVLAAMWASSQGQGYREMAAITGHSLDTLFWFGTVANVAQWYLVLWAMKDTHHA